MNQKSVLLITLCVITTIACKSGPTQQVSSVAAAVSSPSTVKATGYVNDEANVIDEATRRQLVTALAALKDRRKIDFSVVTVKSTGDKSVADYSLALARERKKDSIEANVSGLLLLVAVDDRNWHIQISNNLEPHLTKELLTNLSTPMTDAFRQKQYGEGIRKYVNAIVEKLDQLAIPDQV
jgi:uncharacterized membrane protein YgcG